MNSISPSHHNKRSDANGSLSKKMPPSIQTNLLNIASQSKNSGYNSPLMGKNHNLGDKLGGSNHGNGNLDDSRVHAPIESFVDDG